MPPTSAPPPDLTSLLEQAAQALQTGNLASCAHLCEQVLSQSPNHPRAMHLQALGMHFAEKTSEAIRELESLCQIHTGYAPGWSDLGSLLMEQNRWTEAESALRKATACAPATAAAPWYNLGNLLRLCGALPEAETAYRDALTRQPHHIASLHNLAATLLDQGRPAEAVPLLQTARAQAPRQAEIAFALGNALRTQGRLEDALENYDTALALNPAYGAAHTNRGNLLSEQGRANEAASAYQNALHADPDNARYGSNLLCALHYLDGITPQALLKAHLAWHERFVGETSPPQPVPPPLEDGNRPLRVGLVSADFGCHPVGWFALPLLRGARTAGLTITLYSDRKAEDEITALLQQAADTVHHCAGQDDETVARWIRNDGINILIDMSGHTGGNRMGLFAHRAAPVQATWAAYVGTTGLAAMDYLIADHQQIPPDQDASYRETILRLPVGYVPYAPPPYAPDPSALPPPEKGLLLGSFNNPAKLSESCLALWAGALDALPTARLLIKFRHLDDPPTAQRLRMRFAAAGGDTTRLIIEGGCPHQDLLANYGRLHIALDTTPYSGGLTTLEALWMGVPVITLPGSTFASRHSLTHLHHLGLTELCATDADDFVARVKALGSDSDRLQHYRQSLRATLQSAPLCDGEAFANHFATLLRQAVMQRVAKTSKDTGEAE